MMSQEKISNIAFNELMANAFRAKEANPNMDTVEIVKAACIQYEDREDYGDITFQVAMNLVNADR
jgi:hypothetical protein